MMEKQPNFILILLYTYVLKYSNSTTAAATHVNIMIISNHRELRAIYTTK